MEDTSEIDEPENAGGQGGGQEDRKLILKRSELATLRRLADRFPFTEAEREQVKDNVMDVLRTSKSRRHRIAAARTVAALEKVNLDELKTCLSARGEGQPVLTIQNNVAPVLIIEVEGDHAGHNGKPGANGTPHTPPGDGGQALPVDGA